MHFPRIAAWGLGLALLAGPAVAGREPESPPSAPPDAPAENGPLSGPTVKDHAPGGREDKAMHSMRGTLVERDFEGKLKLLDVRPEEAALALLDLSEPDVKRTAAVLQDRAALMDSLVRENLDLLLELRAARAGGDQQQIGALTKRMREAFRPLGEGGGLLEKLASALPRDKSDRLRGLVDEYYRALAEDERKTMDWKDVGPAGEKRARGAALVRVSLEVLGQEIKRSYERIAADGTQRLERLIAALELNDEQEAAMRRMATEYAQKTKLNASGLQRAELFSGIIQLLTPAQRAKFAKYLREDGAR